MEKKLSWYQWFYRLKYALVAAGVFKGGNYGVLHISIDEKPWRHFYDDGYTPIEAVLIEIQEGGEPTQ